MRAAGLESVERGEEGRATARTGRALGLVDEPPELLDQLVELLDLDAGALPPRVSERGLARGCIVGEGPGGRIGARGLDAKFAGERVAGREREPDRQRG